MRRFFAALFALACLFLSGHADAQAVGKCGKFNLPCWSTSGRPFTPGAGTFGYNTTLNALEFWNAASVWVQLSQSGLIDINTGTTGTLTVSRGGTSQTSFTANLPLIGNGTGAIAQGTRSGNTTSFATTTGSLPAGNCAQFDANGNIVNSGGVCGGGGGSGTVNAGNSGEIAYYGTTGTAVTGNSNHTVSAGAMTHGIVGSVLGQSKYAGSSTGTVTVQPQAAAGTYNFNLPTSAGSSGQPLLSGGGGATAQTYGTLGVGAGGTGLTGGTSGGVPYYSGAATIASSGALTQNRLVLGGGAGAAPTVVGSLGTVNQVLHGNAGGAPSYGAVDLANDTSGTLTVPQGGTGQTTFTSNAPLIGNAGGAIATGTRTGNTTAFATATGATTSGSCVQYDASGNLTAVGFNCGSGAGPPQGRLTLTRGLPIMTSTVAAVTNIFYTPALGNVIPINNGTTYIPTTFTELTNITSDSAFGNAGPLAVSINKNYDLFVWLNGSTVTLTRGPAWTSDTGRGSGAGTTELTLVRGLWLNAQNITNGPNAQRGTYVGTVRSNGTSTIDFQLGANVPASPPTPAVIGVWNLYNQAQARPNIADQSAAWTFNSASQTQLNTTNNNRISWVQGIADNANIFEITISAVPTNVVGALCVLGWGLDSTTAILYSDYFMQPTTTLIGGTTPVSANLKVFVPVQPVLGYHFVQAMQQANGTDNCALVASNGNAQIWY